MRAACGRIWYIALASRRGQIRAALALVVLVGVVGGVTLAAVAGGRRVGSSFERLQEATGAADIELDFGFENPPDPAVVDEIAELVDVESTSLLAFVAIAPDVPGHFPFDSTIGFTSIAEVGRDAIEGVIVEGRGLGDDPNEILLNRTMADELGVDVGDTIPLASLSTETGARIFEGGEEPTDADGPRTTMTVVGITKDIEDVSDTPETYMIVPDAYVDQNDVFHVPSIVHVRMDSGADVTAAVDALRREYPEADVLPVADFGARIEDGIRVQSLGLFSLALAVGLTGLIAIAQLVGRTARLWSAESAAVSALGATTLDRRIVSVVRVLPAAIVGALLAVGLGLLGASRTITGLAHQAEPDPGRWYDWPVIVVVAVVCIAVVLLVAWFGGRPRRHSYAGRATTLTAPLPVVAAFGVRRAVSADASRWSGRGALATLGVALVIVVAVLTFSHSVDELFASPDAWGVNFDAALRPGETPDAIAATMAEIEADDDIAAATLVHEGEVTLERPDGSEYAARVDWVEPGKGTLDPWHVVDGESFVGEDDVLAGQGVLADSGLGIGDQLEIQTNNGSVSLHVAGEVITYSNDRTDDGIIISPEQAIALFGDERDLEGSQVVVRFREGIDHDAALARLQERYDDAGPVPAPGTIDNLDELGLLPALLGIVVAILGLFAVGQSLTMSVTRDRRPFATLRAVGATRGQRRRVVVVQAATIVLIGVMVGMPLGIVLGRAVYNQVAEGVGAIAQPAVPPFTLIGVAIAAVVFVLALAMWPARRAALVRSKALRSE